MTTGQLRCRREQRGRHGEGRKERRGNKQELNRGRETSEQICRERETQRHEAAALGLGPSPQGVPCPYDDTAHRQPRGIKH